jgi:hypothetical protein
MDLDRCRKGRRRKEVRRHLRAAHQHAPHRLVRGGSEHQEDNTLVRASTQSRDKIGFVVLIRPWGYRETTGSAAAIFTATARPATELVADAYRSSFFGATAACRSPWRAPVTVGLLRRGRQIADRHLLDHAPAKKAYLHLGLLS